MSIIEKAAGRLAKPTASAPAQEPAPALPIDFQPAATAPVEPVQPAEAVGIVPPVTPGKSRSRTIELNLAKLQEAGMVTPNAGRSAIAEEFRAIKRTLITQALEQPGKSAKPNNLIMVTSSLPGEGKTFCAVNLAISIAIELDHTVLLVDADVARPSILRNLGLDPEPGLMDVLLGKSLDVADVMLKTNVDTLSILPAGSSHRHATELLASQTMSKLLNELATRYPDRLVIFDSPPLLLTSEARVLAQQMGQVVVVVEGEITTQNALKNSLGQIAGCQNINLIYNKAKPFRGGEQYGYYYS
ncbi:MAG TPA: XrtA-associated tyrosine autokinase [Noviherbaspirillum sp.]|uniref:XrtA-associated tyrosine autokinase n=1 Tax=Noviherbaspirillum sp. TaxID=1926288 RepID=UPI002DDD7FE0|nr:XrtA-associated tyrosine autokinase [Noviherbaspirillum sp.]HEV2612177.1 XrtA-associated tyrosine autokinase [Noviherbaspirillum sp.]